MVVAIKSLHRNNVNNEHTVINNLLRTSRIEPYSNTIVEGLLYIDDKIHKLEEQIHAIILFW